MKNTLTRVLTLVLALCLVLSLTACGGNQTQSTAPETSSEAPASSATETPAESAAPAEEDGPLTPYADPITLSWAVSTSAVQQFIDGDTYEDNVWTRKIKEELNIDVEVGFSADGSTDAFNNQMNVRLASGDLPDVFMYGDHTWFYQALDAGYITDITDVYNNYATDDVKYWEGQYPGGFEGATVNGRLYAYPYIVDNFHQAINLWIRDDWLANTGKSVPTTIDELTELMRVFTFEDPDGNGVDDTFGLAVSGDILQNNYGTLMGLFQAYGVPVFTKSGIFYRGEDGKITYALLDPNCKEALKVAKSWYDEGLIDPEFTVKDVANMESDITTGKYGMMYHACWGTWHPFNYSYQAEGVITRPYSQPKAEGYQTRIGINSNATERLFMVNSAYEHPEAAIKILNLYEKVAISGTSEEFEKYWANEQYRFCPMYIGIPTELWAPVVHDALRNDTGDQLSGTALENYKYVVGFEDGSLADNTNAYGAWGQLSLGGSMEIDINHQKAGEEVVNLMASELPATWIEKSSVLGDMALQEFISIIKGETPVDHFDTFVSDWLAAGGQDVLDEMEALYPAN